MKVEEVTRQTMRELVAPYDIEARRQAYREGRFPRADKVTDLDRRYRWDLFYKSGLAMLFDTGIGGQYESGINGDHIYTALKRVIPSLSEGEEK